MTAQTIGSSLKVRGLSKTYRSKRGPFTALNQVSLHISPGEVLAVVGESGCGKSTLSRLLVGLDKADVGDVEFEGRLLYKNKDEAANNRDIAIVFQDPYSSLNPKMKVLPLIAEAFNSNVMTERDPGVSKRQYIRQRVIEYLAMVGLGEQHLNRYPHEFSGGQMQRIAIARALAQQPKLLVLDEPTAALDVSVQAQILMLLKDLQKRLGLSMLFISHDLGSVSFIADRTLVMYLGNLVEQGPTRGLLDTPRHHYTRALIDAVPSIHSWRQKTLKALPTRDSDETDRPVGCIFSHRCLAADDRCKHQSPTYSADEKGHGYACFYPLTESTL